MQKISLTDKNNLQDLYKWICKDMNYSNRVNIHKPTNSPIKVFTVEIPGEYDFFEKKFLPSSSGTSTDLAGALFSAAGEHFERSTIAKPFSGMKQTFSCAQMPKNINALSYEQLIEMQGLHKFQFHISKMDLNRIQLNSELEWVQGIQFIDQKKIWVPLQSVTFEKKNRNYFSVSSNGCAFGSNRNSAIQGALLELIERDTLMRSWWRKEPPEFVDYQSILKKFIPDIHFAFGPWLDKISVLYFKGLGKIPVFFCIFHSHNELNHPAFVMSGACHLNPEKCLRKAFLELAEMLNFKLKGQKKVVFDQKKISNFDENFDTFEAHHANYGFDQMSESIYFMDILKNKNKKLFNFNEIKNFELSPEENVGLLKELFLQSQLNPVVIDLTPKCLSELGLHVIRTLDPKIVDLNFSHRERRWGKSRLFDQKIKSIHELNQFPHPFP